MVVLRSVLVMRCAGWRVGLRDRRGGAVNPAEAGGSAAGGCGAREPGAAAPWGEVDRAAHTAGAARRSDRRASARRQRRRASPPAVGLTVTGTLSVTLGRR